MGSPRVWGVAERGVRGSSGDEDGCLRVPAERPVRAAPRGRTRRHESGGVSVPAPARRGTSSAPKGAPAPGPGQRPASERSAPPRTPVETSRALPGASAPLHRLSLPPGRADAAQPANPPPLGVLSLLLLVLCLDKEEEPAPDLRQQRGQYPPPSLGQRWPTHPPPPPANRTPALSSVSPDTESVQLDGGACCSGGGAQADPPAASALARCSASCLSRSSLRFCAAASDRALAAAAASPTTGVTSLCGAL